MKMELQMTPPANWEKPDFKLIILLAFKVTKMHAVAGDMSQEATRRPQTLSTLIYIHIYIYICIYIYYTHRETVFYYKLQGIWKQLGGGTNGRHLETLRFIAQTCFFGRLIIKTNIDLILEEVGQQSPLP